MRSLRLQYEKVHDERVFTVEYELAVLEVGSVCRARTRNPCSRSLCFSLVEQGTVTTPFAGTNSVPSMTPAGGEQSGQSKLRHGDDQKGVLSIRLPIRPRLNSVTIDA